MLKPLKVENLKDAGTMITARVARSLSGKEYEDFGKNLDQKYNPKSWIGFVVYDIPKKKIKKVEVAYKYGNRTDGFTFAPSADKSTLQKFAEKPIADFLKNLNK